MSLSEFLQARREGRRYTGPAPKSPACSVCGRAAAACCEGCGADFCAGHWARHSRPTTFAGRKGGGRE